MLTGRPLLYLSLPGVALILGVYWYRRRNKSRNGGNFAIDARQQRDKRDEVMAKIITTTATTAIATTTTTTATITAMQSCKMMKATAASATTTATTATTTDISHNHTHFKLNENISKSLSINGSNASSSNSNSNSGSGCCNENNAITTSFGKSAPIQIVQNCRGGSGSPMKPAAQQAIDSEILKSKIQDVESKVLRSIAEDIENLSSPADLTESLNCRLPFYTRTNYAIKMEPVVIKATKTPKISPENSFMKSEYIKGEQRQEEEEKEEEEVDDDDDDDEKKKAITKNCIEMHANHDDDDDGDDDDEQQHDDKELDDRQQQQALQQQELSQSQQHDGKEEEKDMENAKQQQVEQQQQQQSQSQELQLDLQLLEATTPITTTTTTTTTTDDDVVVSCVMNAKRNENNASPSLSLCSSVQSGDSGKGSSLPRSEATRAKTTYEFFYPISLIGLLYGRNRAFINHIKAKTSADVSLRKNPFSSKLRVCVVEGNETEINNALAMIRQRLPAKRYPNFTMQRIHIASPQTIVPLSSASIQNLQLNLIEGINNDIVVSAVISGGQIFVQHPSHPTHPSLAVLQKCLYDSYSTSETPMLPGIEINTVCVLAVNGIWYRVQIMEKDSIDDEKCMVTFLDFGGYLKVNYKELRQIRTDFMEIPFQATECILSNIEPIDTCWSPEAADILWKLTKGIVLQAQVAGYNSLNIPEIYLFAWLAPNNVIFINKELVARNLAKWVEIED